MFLARWKTYIFGLICKVLDLLYSFLSYTSRTFLYILVHLLQLEAMDRPYFLHLFSVLLGFFLLSNLNTGYSLQ